MAYGSYTVSRHPCRSGEHTAGDARQTRADPNILSARTTLDRCTASKDGVADEYETVQLTCRMTYWHFSRPAPEQRNRDFKACAGCWSRWLLQGEVEWQAAHGISPDEFIAKASAALSRGRTTPGSSSAGHEPPSTPPRAPPAAAPLLPVGSAGGQTGAQAFFEQLSQLMAWRQAGLLSDSEFANAKRVLGL